MAAIPSFFTARAAVLAITLIALAGCAAPASTPSRVAANGCDTNDGFAMRGVVRAATKRDYDDCRRLPSRAEGVLVSRGSGQP